MNGLTLLDQLIAPSNRSALSERPDLFRQLLSTDRTAETNGATRRDDRRDDADSVRPSNPHAAVDSAPQRTNESRHESVTNNPAEASNTERAPATDDEHDTSPGESEVAADPQNAGDDSDEANGTDAAIAVDSSAIVTADQIVAADANGRERSDKAVKGEQVRAASPNVVDAQSSEVGVNAADADVESKPIADEANEEETRADRRRTKSEGISTVSAGDKPAQSKSPEQLPPVVESSTSEGESTPRAQSRSDSHGVHVPIIQTGATVQSADAAGNSSQNVVASTTNRLPQNLIGPHGNRATSEAATSGVDQARFIQRVARAFEAAQSRGGEIRLRLHPPELGALRLEVKVERGAMTARIETETAAARTILIDNLPALRDRLAEQGIRVEHFEVDIPDRQPGSLPDGAASQHQDDHGSSSDARSYSSQTHEAELPDTDESMRSVVGNQQLNVLV